MAAWLIAAMGLVYLFVSVDLLLKGNTGLGIAFIYSLPVKFCLKDGIHPLIIPAR